MRPDATLPEMVPRCRLQLQGRPVVRTTKPFSLTCQSLESVWCTGFSAHVVRLQRLEYSLLKVRAVLALE